MQVPRGLNLELDEVAWHVSSEIKRKKKKKNPRTNAGSTEVPQHQRIPHILDKR